MNKFIARLISQVVHDDREYFDLYLETTNRKNLIKLECLDEKHADELSKSISRCGNYVEDCIVLYDPKEREKMQEHIDQASREKDI